MSDVREVGPATIVYVRDPGHRHEGHHRIAVAGKQVVVKGDGATKSRSRLGAAKRALGAVSERGGSDDDALEQMIGALVLMGATNVTVDDQAIIPDAPDRIVASLSLDVIQRGDTVDVVVSSLGGES